MQEKILQLIEDIRKRPIDDYSEDAVKQAVILRLLTILGWDPYNVDQVCPEFSVETRKVDYCLRQNKKNYAFIEVKRPSENLDEHQEQLLDYAFRQGIELAVLTNGISWWFYLPLNKGSWEQRKFFTIDMLNQPPEKIAEVFINLLSKDAILTEKSVEFAKQIYHSNAKRRQIENELPHAWNSLFDQPDELLVELLNDTVEKRCGFRADPDQICEFLETHKRYITIPEQPFPETVQPSFVRPSERKENKKYSPAGYAGKSPVSFTLHNQTFNIDTWREMLYRTCLVLCQKNRSDFEQKVLQLKGKKRPYFSRRENDLRYPLKIAENLYVESNLSANSIVSLCQKLATLFGHSSNLKIVTK